MPRFALAKTPTRRFPKTTGITYPGAQPEPSARGTSSLAQFCLCHNTHNLQIHINTPNHQKKTATAVRSARLATATMSGSAVLVPLYVYPFEGAWQPLYDALAAHPRTQFLVVVNPGNGPGPASLPDANYCREIPKLRSHSNAVVFGYVHVQWAQRSLDAVLQDVETYAAWPSQPSQTAPLRVDGIFVDETPTAADARTLDFLGSLTSRVHRLWSASPTHATSGDTPAVATPVAAGTARTPTVRTPNVSSYCDASVFTLPYCSFTVIAISCHFPVLFLDRRYRQSKSYQDTLSTPPCQLLPSSRLQLQQQAGTPQHSTAQHSKSTGLELSSLCLASRHSAPDVVWPPLLAQLSSRVPTARPGWPHRLNCIV